ncbi:MAG: shikimate kinase, partial [Clostridia bacterium]|nr:shikimate kinase [Clostridia bacterium]
MMKNIILIGMPGSGKTTVGTYLSEVLGYGYIDSDSVIIAREGKRLHEIIAEKGVEGFLDVEARVNAEICADRCVIATGGSAVYRDKTMQ